MGRLSIDRSFAIKHGATSAGGDPGVQPTTHTEAEIVEQCEPDKKQIDYPIVSRHIPDSGLPFITADEVRKRSGNNGTRLWIVVDDVVLDCSGFKKRHPGGRGIIEGFGGQDCSWQWWTFHSQQVLDRHGRSLRVGKTSGVENRHTKPERHASRLKVSGEQW